MISWGECRPQDHCQRFSVVVTRLGVMTAGHFEEFKQKNLHSNLAMKVCYGQSSRLPHRSQSDAPQSTKKDSTWLSHCYHLLRKSLTFSGCLYQALVPKMHRVQPLANSPLYSDNRINQIYVARTSKGVSQSNLPQRLIYSDSVANISCGATIAANLLWTQCLVFACSTTEH